MGCVHEIQSNKVISNHILLTQAGMGDFNEKKKYKDEDGITIRYDVYILEHEPNERSEHVTDNEHYSTLPQ